MRSKWSAVAFLAVWLMPACGADDVVDGPFITDWRLDERACAIVDDETRCYDLALTVVGGAGSAEASCEFSALDRAGAALALPAPVPSIEPFSIRAGDAPVFALELPVITDEAFLRWQVDCDPGAPG